MYALTGSELSLIISSTLNQASLINPARGNNKTIINQDEVNYIKRDEHKGTVPLC